MWRHITVSKVLTQEKKQEKVFNFHFLICLHFYLLFYLSFFPHFLRFFFLLLTAYFLCFPSLLIALGDSKTFFFKVCLFYAYESSHGGLECIGISSRIQLKNGLCIRWIESHLSMVYQSFRAERLVAIQKYN